MRDVVPHPRGEATDDLLLYHAWMSSASRRARFCLEEKQLAYDSILIDILANDQHTPQYRAVNPNGFVPALRHHGGIVIECTVIGEYLDEVFPQNPLRPGDAFERAQMRIWTRHVDDVVIRAFQVASWNRIIRPVAMAWTDAELEARLAQIPTQDRREDWRRMARQPFTDREIAGALEGIRESLRRMEAALRKGPWLTGDTFSLADIAMVPYIVRIGEFVDDGISLDDVPAVADWWTRITARPAFTAARIAPVGDPAADVSAGQAQA